MRIFSLWDLSLSPSRFSVGTEANYGTLKRAVLETCVVNKKTTHIHCAVLSVSGEGRDCYLTLEKSKESTLEGFAKLSPLQEYLLMQSSNIRLHWIPTR